MQYQKKRLLDNIPNQPSKFSPRNWVTINDDSIESISPIPKTKLKTSMRKSSLCNYSDTYIPVKGTITVVGVRATTTASKQIGKVNK